MKDRSRRQKELFILIIMTLLIFASPVILAIASPNGQTVPTAAPDTDTPTITPTQSITNTGTRRPPSAATSTSTPLAAGATLNPTERSAAQTATFVAGHPTGIVTLTPLPPTVTLSSFTMTTTNVAATQTFTVTSQVQPTPTLPNANPGQNTFDNESYLLGFGSLLIILAVYIWARGRNKGAGTK